jgi:hypothetical protein
MSRNPNHINPGVEYPEGLSSEYIYGISKPNRYFPAQLMKDIELLRLENDSNLQKYSILWGELLVSMRQCENIEDVAVNIALKVIRIYISRGISLEEISNMIFKGYKPSGPIKEHGPLSCIVRIWNGILSNLRMSADANEVAVAAILEPLVISNANKAISDMNALGNNYSAFSLNISES